MAASKGAGRQERCGVGDLAKAFDKDRHCNSLTCTEYICINIK